ncbi:hypothetical protein BKA69DRAFT_1041185 [Paraphysoderma sedebokerense]|nr:hypothetical protein BKA69DRAFT_1041185 [Paraphysoderma sedebokerense]
MTMLSLISSMFVQPSASGDNAKTPDTSNTNTTPRNNDQLQPQNPPLTLPQQPTTPPELADEWVVLPSSSHSLDSTNFSIPSSSASSANTTPKLIPSNVPSNLQAPPEIDIPPSIPSDSSSKTTAGTSSSTFSTDPYLALLDGTNSTELPKISRRKLKVLRNKFQNHILSLQSQSHIPPSGLVNPAHPVAFKSKDLTPHEHDILKELKNRELKLRKMSKLGLRSGAVGSMRGENGFVLGAGTGSSTGSSGTTLGAAGARKSKIVA